VGEGQPDEVKPDHGVNRIGSYNRRVSRRHHDCRRTPLKKTDKSVARGVRGGKKKKKKKGGNRTRGAVFYVEITHKGTSKKKVGCVSRFTAKNWGSGEKKKKETADRRFCKPFHSKPLRKKRGGVKGRINPTTGSMMVKTLKESKKASGETKKNREEKPI